MSQTFARRQRRYALKQERRRGYRLDAYNETLAASNRHLHPTRGFRKINPKRNTAQTIADMTRQGMGTDTATMKEVLTR